MMRLYYIESKVYYIDAQGVDHQVADGGDMPLLTTNKKEALETAKRMEDFYKSRFGYKTILSNEENPARKDNCLFAVRQVSETLGTRRELRVYKMWTL